MSTDVDTSPAPKCHALAHQIKQQQLLLQQLHIGPLNDALEIG